MSNFFWYVGLALIGVSTAIAAITSNRHKYKLSTLIAFYLFATGITWIGEYMALGIFNGYAYKTDIINDHWAQNLIGHLLLNTTIWPAAATLMVTGNLKYRWIPVITAFFIYAEYLFLKIGIYEQHWWRYYMSVVVVVAFLLISRNWFFAMDKKRSGTVRVLTYYFICLVIIHTPFPLLLLMNKQYYRVGFILSIVGDRYWASILFTFCIHLIMSFVNVYFICILKKWYWKPVPYLISVVLQMILIKTNMLVAQDGWRPFYVFFVNAFTYLTFILIEKYTWRQSDL